MTFKKEIIPYVIVILIATVIKGFSQSSSDTIRIQKEQADIARYTNYRSERGTYTINGRTVDSVAFTFITKRLDSIRDVIDKNMGNYFIFLGLNNKVVEEGWWHGDFFSGYYRNYYPNGNIKEEGYYSDICDSIFLPGEKTGKWKYYAEKGAIRKTTVHVLTLRRENNESDPALPPCMCSQKMLYTDRSCAAFPISKQKGITYHYSSALLQKKKLDTRETKNDSLLDLIFLAEYASQFMDSVFSKKECINDGVFIIKIFEHSLTDTMLAFSISYVKTSHELENLSSMRNKISRKDYFILKDRKVIITYSYDLRNDTLHIFLPEFKLQDGEFNKYLSALETTDPYKGKYVLNGSKIEATFIYPYYMNIPVEEQIW